MSSVDERTSVIEGVACGHCEPSVREPVEEPAVVLSAPPDRATGRLVGGVSS